MTFNLKVALINQKQSYKTKNNLLKNEQKHPKRRDSNTTQFSGELLLLKSSLTSILRQQNHLQCLQMANQWNGGFRRDSNCCDKYNSWPADLQPVLPTFISPAYDLVCMLRAHYFVPSRCKSGVRQSN